MYRTLSTLSRAASRLNRAASHVRVQPALRVSHIAPVAAHIQLPKLFSTSNAQDAEFVEQKTGDVMKDTIEKVSKMSPEEAESHLAEELKDFEGFNDNFEADTDATPKAEIRDDLRVAENKERVVGEKKARQFQTETRQMLDIVTNSLYTDREVFLRELISNASDALEKARYLKTKDELLESEKPLEVRIFTDEVNKTITLQDTGIGMTDEDLVSLLGTIARSGSKAWVREKANDPDAIRDNIIGQFGVGFYSSFMVAKKVEVFTRSAKAADGDKPGFYWVSDGSGEYEISEAEGVERGTKIIIHLKDDATSFSVANKVDKIIQKYSNFVGFPIYLNGARLNTIQAIWTLPKNEVTEDQHLEFYRYFSGAYDTPVYRMHFKTDAPININALFYFPERHMEKFGVGRTEPGTSLYSRKVLIKSKAQGLLPDYFRFIRGVVDSEDVPLNISRENMQDSLLISRISSVLTKRIIKFLLDEERKDPEKYAKWYQEFSTFIKEGVCSDFSHKNELAKLLRFESSMEPKGKLVSLDDYISRMPPSQQNIYYLCVPNRFLAETSPYFEGLKAAGTEVLFLYHGIDDFVMNSIREYNNRKLVSAESSSDNARSEDNTKHADLINYIKEVLGKKVSSVTVSKRISSYPAIVVDHESAATRRMLKMMDGGSFLEMDSSLSRQKLEINPDHPIFVKLMQTKDADPAVAKLVVEQVFDNALLAADILDNPRSMLPRMISLLEKALTPSAAAATSETKAE